MKKIALLYSLGALALFALVINPTQVFADGSCLILNNGGTTTRQVCISPTVWPTPAPFTENIPSQNANGQKVYSPSKTKTTPDTGPDDWALPALFAIAAAGLFIRSKSKFTFKDN